jgi:hypothetical protein
MKVTVTYTFESQKPVRATEVELTAKWRRQQLDEWKAKLADEEKRFKNEA